MINISYQEEVWLRSWGGRTKDDVCLDEEDGRRYILLWNGIIGNWERYYLDEKKRS